jgi:hypothetical protein
MAGGSAREKRQEGKASSKRRRVSLGGKDPEGQNPTSASGVKQTRGLREEEAARRARNPEGGTDRVR